MKRLIAITIISILGAAFGVSDLRNQPLPASPDYRPTLSAEELPEAIAFQKERIRLARKLQGHGAYPEADVKSLESTLARLQNPSGEIPANREIQLAYPIYLQSDAAIASYGLEKLENMAKTLDDDAEKVELLYQRGGAPLLNTLEARAALNKVRRALAAVKANTPANNTLQAAPFFLQGAESLSKLSPQELEDHLKIQQERMKRSTVLFGKEALSVKELTLNIKRLEAARELQRK